MAPIAGFAGVALAVAVADQVSKRAVLRRLAPGERRPLPGGLALVLVRNPRGGLVALPVPLAVGVVVACTALAAVVAAGAAGVGEAAGLGSVVGGAASNVADRVRRGAVVDVLAIRRWRVVNLADVALVVGTVLVLVAALGSAP